MTSRLRDGTDACPKGIRMVNKQRSVRQHVVYNFMWLVWLSIIQSHLSLPIRLHLITSQYEITRGDRMKYSYNNKLSILHNATVIP